MKTGIMKEDAHENAHETILFRKTLMKLRVMSVFMVLLMNFQQIQILYFKRIEKITMPNESALIVLHFP